MNNGNIVHLESRESSMMNENNKGLQNGNNNASQNMDVLLRVDIKHSALVHFLKTLRRNAFLTEVHLLSSKSVNLKRK